MTKAEVNQHRMNRVHRYLAKHHGDCEAETPPPIDSRCMYCWHRPAVGEAGGIRLCTVHLAYAHDMFVLPVRLFKSRQIDLWRARGYDVVARGDEW
jgi:hypothetical protein